MAEGPSVDLSQLSLRPPEDHSGAVTPTLSAPTSVTAPIAERELKPGGRYKLVRRIGCGSFGQIFLGTSLLTGEEVAVKLVSSLLFACLRDQVLIEFVQEPVESKHPQLHYEYKVYRLLAGGCTSCLSQDRIVWL
jgi:hypothetical protein